MSEKFRWSRDALNFGWIQFTEATTGAFYSAIFASALRFFDWGWLWNSEVAAVRIYREREKKMGFVAAAEDWEEEQSTAVKFFGFWFCFCSSLIRVPQQNFLVGCWGQNISNVEGREENSLAVWLWWTEVDCGGAVNKNCSSSLNFDSSKVKKFAAALHKERIFFYVYFAVQYWTCLGPNLQLG